MQSFGLVVGPKWQGPVSPSVGFFFEPTAATQSCGPEVGVPASRNSRRRPVKAPVSWAL